MLTSPVHAEFEGNFPLGSCMERCSRFALQFPVSFPCYVLLLGSSP